MHPPGRKRFQQYEAFIPRVSQFYRALERPLSRCLRTNTLRINPSDLANTLRSQGYRVQASLLADYLLEVEGLRNPGNTLESTMGYFASQALTSALAVIALDPKPDEVVCDICAAPGSKTTHMAQSMNNTGLILANDLRDRRLRALDHNIRRLGILNVITTQYPGQSFPLRWRFDRVLADVPCSGEGTFRFGDSPGRVFSIGSGGFLSKIQRDILLRAFDILAQDGTLLYSTCTYNPDENEAVVQHLLENRPSELLPIDLAAPHSTGLRQWSDSTYDQQMEKCWRIYPHQIDSVGFFLAKIRRRSSPA